MTSAPGSPWPSGDGQGQPPGLPPAAPPTGPYIPPPATFPAGPSGLTRDYAAQAGEVVRGVVRRVRADEVGPAWARRGRVAAERGIRRVSHAVQAVDVTGFVDAAGHARQVTSVRAARTARDTGQALKTFGVGIGMFWQGLFMFLTRPLLWLFALVPAVVVYLLTIGCRVGVRLTRQRLAEWVTGFADDWPAVLQWMLQATVRWGLTALANAVIGFLVIPLTLLVGAPFYVLTVRWLERRQDRKPDSHLRVVPAPGRLRATGFVLSQTALVTLVVTGGGAVLSPLLLIPGINVLAAVAIAVLLNGFVVGLLAVGLPLHHRGIGARLHQVRYAWRNRWPLVGFGAMSVLVLGIPFAPLRWVTIPAVFVGAVLLHSRFPHEAVRRYLPPSPAPAGWPLAAQPTYWPGTPSIPQPTPWPPAWQAAPGPRR